MIRRYENQDLQTMNTFGVSAKAKAVYRYDAEEDLRRMWQEGVFKGRYMALGGGSNVLFDGDFDGNIIVSEIRNFDISEGKADGSVEVRYTAGWCWDELVKRLVESGINGAENLSGIPGCGGSAVVGNIGAYGVEMKDIVERVRAFDTTRGEFREFTNEECRFGYRESIFKYRGSNPGLIVTEVVVKLHRGVDYNPTLTYGALKRVFEGKARVSATDVRREVIAMRDSKLPNPAVLGNAGSFFTNPIEGADVAEELRRTWPEMPIYPSGIEGSVKLSAGWLIDKAGLKGFRKGRAGVDERNALVLVNHGGATAGEILEVARIVRETVAGRFGVELTPEVRIIR